MSVKTKHFFRNIFKEYLLIFSKINNDRASNKEGISFLLRKYNEFVKEVKEFNPKNDYFAFIYNEKLKTKMENNQTLKITCFKDELLAKVKLLCIDLYEHGVETYISKGCSRKIIFNPDDYTINDLALERSNIYDTILKEDKLYQIQMAKRHKNKQVNNNDIPTNNEAIADEEIKLNVLDIPPVAKSSSDEPFNDDDYTSISKDEIIDDSQPVINKDSETQEIQVADNPEADEFADFEEDDDSIIIPEEFEEIVSNESVQPTSVANEQENNETESFSSSENKSLNESETEIISNSQTDDEDELLDDDEEFILEDDEQDINTMIENDQFNETLVSSSQTTESTTDDENFDFGNEDIQPISNKYDHLANNR